MHTLKLAKNGGAKMVGKELWQFPTTVTYKPQSTRGCCAVLHLHEENARFVLLAIILSVYLLSGAAIFHCVERSQEIKDKQNYTDTINRFLEKHHRSINKSELLELLYIHGNASMQGLFYQRERWDFPGAFYFVGTLVSTIGFGMTTPRTATGKFLVICYGLFGCAGTILFFNLFLERIVTVFAYILRLLEVQRAKLRRKLAKKPPVPKIRVSESDMGSDLDSMDMWKPNVYGVFTCMLLMSSLLICIAAIMYSKVEGWAYSEAVYYCFVSFATIGFGDFVASQHANTHTGIIFYRIANFLFLTLGCCCIYSLFNIMSMIIRQFLNWSIKKMDCKCQMFEFLGGKKKPYLGLGISQPLDIESDDESQSSSSRQGSIRSSRKGSDAMISLKDFLAQNQHSLVAMHKHLIESTRRKMSEQHYDTSAAISATGVGPLAILTSKFGEE